MISTNAEDRVKRNQIMEKFCALPRPMLWQDVNIHEKIDATLFHEKKPTKLCGIAKIVSQPGIFGSKPSVSIEKELVDFLSELAILCSVKAAVIFKFRDRSMYWRIEDVDKLPFENGLKRGKSFTTYQVPIQHLKAA